MNEVSAPTGATEVTAGTFPRVYVACLACYNAGRLSGRWHVADDELAENVAEWMEEHDAALPPAVAEFGPHEEYAIHDSEGFGSHGPDEFDDLGAVGAIGAAIIEHGDAFVAYLEFASEPDSAEDAVAEFEDRYCGEFDAFADYAAEFASDVYGIGRTPRGDNTAAEFLSRYFDYDKFARDLAYDYDTAPASGGRVFVFRSS